VFHIDFEYAMHSAILTKFPNSTISCCRFHLGRGVNITDKSIWDNT
jgi:hypothetical protein